MMRPVFDLDLPLLQHQGVLPARPVLDRSESEPVRGAVLVLAMHRVAGGQVLVRIPAHQQSSRLVRPLLVAEAVQIIAQIPGDVGECAQPRGRIAEVAPLVLAAGRRLGFVRGDIHGSPR